MYSEHNTTLNFLLYKFVLLMSLGIQDKVHTRTGHEGPEVPLYSFFNLGARWGGWSTPRPDSFTSGKDPVPLV